MNTEDSALWLKLNRKLKAMLQLNWQIFLQTLKNIRILFKKSSSYFFFFSERDIFEDLMDQNKYSIKNI